ncbi:MAG: ATP-binding protein [Planctomycetes bacterium]|nr:ATP-binding protein [Planctomycetota bacterium]
MFQRALSLPTAPKVSFFLWGPRQTGKSSLLKEVYGDTLYYDFLKTDEYTRLAARPSLLREEILARSEKKGVVVLDEVQKVPMLLDEVHWLIENTHYKFAMCGSSARKVRRGAANLLGGRAIRYELHGLVSPEIGRDFDLLRMLKHGYLPRHYLNDSAPRLIQAYVQDYLKEEIAAEGLTRRLPAFVNFLGAAALSDTEILSYSTIARDCGVSNVTVREYFNILEDTMIGRSLAAYTKRPKRRVISSPKFYFSDVGVVNVLAKRRTVEPRSETFGKAFENWVCHELSARKSYADDIDELSYWRLTTGVEVDFIINDVEVAIEAKGTENVTDNHLRGLREIKNEHPKVKNRIVVSLDPRARRTEDGIDILPYREFADRLWNGALFEK